MQLSAVLPAPELNVSASIFPFQSNWSENDAIRKLAMPEAWVRGAIVVRCNSLLRGHSAVRLEVMQTLLKLLEHNLTPLVPLRGSISASGDLCPLSYIAGTLEGNPDVQVWAGKGHARRLLPANEALQEVGICPVSFGPKEILGLLNGTAFSVAVASIAQHEADTLVSLAQILTAMGVEALLGTSESFGPFIGAIRPHSGQVEIASNIRSFLSGSRLARTGEEEELFEGQLRQDRYALRTSAQWLGPFLEDMRLAREQLEVELNSTTDNPLIDLVGEQIHHGGNFQATAITSSTEKTRSALEKIGKLIFAQSTELLDVKMNHNLPPNLAVDEPSLSYPMKGVDINMAAYMSELSFLANPVGNHVQSAEMGNQAVNSLALISARYTHMAIDVVSLMVSAYLYTLCQALDLRAMNDRFLTQLSPAIKNLTARKFERHLQKEEMEKLQQSTFSAFARNLGNTTTMDSQNRFISIAQSCQHHVVDALELAARTSPRSSDLSLSLVTSWTEEAADLSQTLFCTNRDSYIADPDASEYLGVASKIMYRFVRNELGVPMHRGLVDHPTTDVGKDAALKKNTGTQISIIYKALREEKLTVPIMECMKGATETKPEKLIMKAKF